MRPGHVAAAALLLGGCASLPQRPDARGGQALPAEVAAYYDYPRAPIEATMELTRERRAWREYRVTFPLAAVDFEPTEPVVELEWFESTAPGPRPAVVFNAILGGDYPLERGICRFLAANGFHTALLHRKTLKVGPDQPVERMELLLRQGVVRIRQSVDWMEQQETVDASRMGTFGISMGAIASVLCAAVEPRLRAHVAALPGGSIPDILASTHDSMLTKPRMKYLKAHDLTPEELDAMLRQLVRTDPLLLAPYADPDALFVVVAMFDRTIGTENSLRLWRALGRPRVTFLPFGHYTAYLSVPYLKFAGLRFLKEKLEP
ncbi:MAG TPA: hypothetical protein VGB20_01490 [bacterium]